MLPLWKLDTDTEVKGTLKWADPDCIPTAGTTQAGWVFKPDDSKYYEDLTGTAAITVARATPAVVTVPTVAEREYNPAVALADSDMTGGSVTEQMANHLPEYGARNEYHSDCKQQKAIR